ncbi:MAG: hypothetical protein Q7J27_00195, partial [Syntrophales bacterium]|nr:hypothetical protein [Syntrophales bacterium]
RGGGRKYLKWRCIHPHPSPLPSREREGYDFLRDWQVLMALPKVGFPGFISYWDYVIIPFDNKGRG